MKFKFKSTLGVLIVALALSALTAASALAAGAPIVQTKPASSIAGTEAKLNGTVNPNGATTKYHFEYGATIAYGSSTTAAPILGTTEKSVGTTTEGLTTKTTYHFRIVATNSSGTSYGADEVFSTPVEAPEFAAKPGQRLTEVKYVGSSGSAGWTDGGGGVTFTCTAVNMEGIVTNSKTVRGKFVFTGCYGQNLSCRSKAGKEDEIATEELQGTLVYISKTAKTVGIVFKPLSGKYLALWGCSSNYSDELRGGIVVPMNNLNVFKSSLSEGHLEATSEHTQRIKEYETGNGKFHIELESNLREAFEPIAWTIAETSLNTNKEVEIEA